MRLVSTPFAQHSWSRGPAVHDVCCTLTQFLLILSLPPLPWATPFNLAASTLSTTVSPFFKFSHLLLLSSRVSYCNISTLTDCQWFTGVHNVHTASADYHVIVTILCPNPNNEKVNKKRQWYVHTTPCPVIKLATLRTQRLSRRRARTPSTEAYTKIR